MDKQPLFGNDGRGMNVRSPGGWNNGIWGLFWILFAGFFGLNTCQGAAPSVDSPIGFFTDVSERLLQAEANLSVHRIQLYPTNQYTPAVHRLLQVAANLYDSTTNRPITEYPYVPTVFRPVFTNDSGAVYITGYIEEVGANVLGAAFRDLSNPSDRAALQPTDMVWGVPIVIGAKKGLPNFNEFAMQTVVEVRRRLQFTRPMIGAPVNETNQMYIAGISNLFAIEAWNSYTNPFARDVEIQALIEVTTVLTNERNIVVLSNTISTESVMQVAATNWSGFKAAGAFQIPLSNSAVVLPASTYRDSDVSFVPLDDLFERTVGFPIPQWWLNLDVKVRFTLVDLPSGRILDYVNLRSPRNLIDITTKLVEGGDCETINTSPGTQWCTNRLGNATTAFAPTYGILNQIHIGEGVPQVSDWYSFSLDPTAGADQVKAIDLFRINMGLAPLYNPGSTYYRSNVFYAPFVPFRQIYQHLAWQVNDPLVHYLLTDLLDRTKTNNVDFISGIPPLNNMARVNDRFAPWGNFPNSRNRNYNLTFVDPMVTRSDDWMFPSGERLGLESMGNIHRGTPWQTLYLKPSGVAADTWRNWTGVTDLETAQRLQPTNDWRLVSLLAGLFNTNDPRRLISVNETNMAVWTSALDGITVLTNSLSDDELSANPFASLQFDSLTMSSNSAQAALIENAIIGTRWTQADQRFLNIGEILATPELTTASPWLNRSSIQTNRAITDYAYERIPSQLFSRLRRDSEGFVTGSGSSLEFHFTGFDGYAYVIESSTNLIQWVPVSTNLPTNGLIQFQQSHLSGGQKQFYRSVFLN